MSSQPTEVAPAARRRVPGPVRLMLITWASLAVLGAVAGLALAVSSLLSGTPGTSPLARTGLGLFSGALCGSLLAAGGVALYSAAWALLRLGQWILTGTVGRRPAAEAGQPASSGFWPGVVGAAFGLLLGAVGGGGLGFAAVAAWIGLSPTSVEMQAQAPFWGVVFGFVWGVPLGVILGSLVGTVVGFVAGVRLGRRRTSALPAT